MARNKVAPLKKMRFVKKCQRKGKCYNDELAATEIQDVSTEWIRDTQHRNYDDVSLSLQKKAATNNLVKQLKLYIDSEELIRCGGGRIDNTRTTMSSKFPVLLSQKDKISQLTKQNKKKWPGKKKKK